MGNSIEDYRAAIGLFNSKKRCLYGLVNFRAESYQQIILINLQCSALVLSLFILHMEIYLSTLLLVMFTGGFELYVPGPGPGCVSTSPIIRINCNIYNRKTILISGIILCRRNRDKTRAEHCKLINIIC
jgi:hypothetical protein